MQIKLIPEAKCCVITTTIKKDDVVLLKEHKPEALKKYDENGDEIFAINYRDGASSWTKFGVTFGGANADGNLTLNAIVDGEDEEELKDTVVKNLLGTIEFIQEFEDSVTAEANAIKEKQQALRESILTL